MDNILVLSLDYYVDASLRYRMSNYPEYHKDVSFSESLAYWAPHYCNEVLPPLHKISIDIASIKSMWNFIKQLPDVKIHICLSSDEVRTELLANPNEKDIIDISGYEPAVWYNLFQPINPNNEKAQYNIHSSQIVTRSGRPNAPIFNPWKIPEACNWNDVYIIISPFYIPPHCDEKLFKALDAMKLSDYTDDCLPQSRYNYMCKLIVKSSKKKVRRLQKEGK